MTDKTSKSTIAGNSADCKILKSITFADSNTIFFKGTGTDSDPLKANFVNGYGYGMQESYLHYPQEMYAVSTQGNSDGIFVLNFLTDVEDEKTAMRLLYGRTFLYQNIRTMSEFQKLDEYCSLQVDWGGGSWRCEKAFSFGSLAQPLTWKELLEATGVNISKNKGGVFQFSGMVYFYFKDNKPHASVQGSMQKIARYPLAAPGWDDE